MTGRGGLFDGDGGGADAASGPEYSGGAGEDEAEGAALDVGEGGYRRAPGVLPGKRGPGRPKGAANRKTVEFEKLYRARGFKDPLLFLGEAISRDAVELQAWYVEHERAIRAQGKHLYLAIPTLAEIEAMQIAAADKLLPYLHGKKPVVVEVRDEQLPRLIIDLGSHQLADAAAIAGRKSLSAGAPLIEAAVNKINDLRAGRNEADGAAVQQDGQSVENKGENGARRDD